MKWFENFTFVMKTSINALTEKIADPERMIHQLILDMEEELEIVRAGVAAAIADEIQLGKRVEQARSDAENWLQRATSALQRGDETAARSALEQKVLAEERAAGLQKEYEQQKQQTAKLQQSFRDLEDKIRQARQKQTLLLARLARAESTRRINNALDRSDSCSAFAQFDRLERRVDRSEALCEAYDRMEGRDPAAEELERKLADADRLEQVQAELEELKRAAGDRSS